MPRPPAPSVKPPDPGDRRYRMLVAYDGADFHGFAVNPGVSTVAGALRQSLRRMLGYEVNLACAGRTDAGVHAKGQVVSFDASELDTGRIQHSLNSLCGPSIAVRELQVADDHFDARYSAKFRRYHYLVLNSNVPDPFLRRTTWRVGAPLDIDAMNEAATHFVGEHNFGSFCRKRLVNTADGEVEAPLDRIVEHTQWEALGDDLLRFSIQATAFCQQMVRSITGTLVDVGLGKLRPDEIPGIMAARDRGISGQVAPPEGLTLMHVGY